MESEKEDLRKLEYGQKTRLGKAGNLSGRALGGAWGGMKRGKSYLFDPRTKSRKVKTWGGLSSKTVHDVSPSRASVGWAAAKSDRKSVV